MISESSQQRGGFWAAGASVVSAVVSSACCWLPLGLLAFGVSAGGLAAIFEKTRPIFLIVSAVLLGAGFYLNYFRKEQCAPGSECSTRKPRSRRISRVMLWLSTFMVLAFALFPNYVGALLGGGDLSDAGPLSQTEEIVLGVEGMTCAGCAVTIEKALSEVDGVQGVVVSYEESRVVVTVDAASPPSQEALNQAVEMAGYHSSPDPVDL